MVRNTELCQKLRDLTRREIAAFTVAPVPIRKAVPPLFYLPFINENDKGNDRKQSAAAICGNKAFFTHWFALAGCSCFILKNSIYPDELAVRAPSDARSGRRRRLNRWAANQT
jgi:hypothetical protein